MFMRYLESTWPSNNRALAPLKRPSGLQGGQMSSEGGRFSGWKSAWSRGVMIGEFYSRCNQAPFRSHQLLDRGAHRVRISGTSAEESPLHAPGPGGRRRAYLGVRCMKKMGHVLKLDFQGKLKRFQKFAFHTPPCCALSWARQGSSVPASGSA